MMSVPFLLRLTMKQATVTNPGAKSGSGGKKRYMMKEATARLHAARTSKKKVYRSLHMLSVPVRLALLWI